MRLIRKWGLTALSVVLVVLIGLALFKRDEILRFRAVASLFSEDRIVANFSSMGHMFRWVLVPRGTDPASPLREGTAISLPPDVEDWLVARDVTSLLVLKSGKIRVEDYYLGSTRDDRRIGWSISKSFLSALFGVVLDEGAIASLDDPVTDYAPQLADSAYANVTIRQVLNMTSGVQFNEDYLDYYSDVNRMGRVLALGGSMDEFAAVRSDRFAEPGEVFAYNSIDTHVAGMVLRGATGKPLADLMSEKIIEPLAMELTPYYLTDGFGTAFALGGLNLTSRDFARFGQMMLQRGVWNGARIVPEPWIEEATRKQAPTEPGQLSFGYHWWMPSGAAPGEYMARGIYGQYLYINEELDVVVVVTSADLFFREEGAIEQNIAVMRLLAQSV